MAAPKAKRFKFDLRDEVTVLVGPPNSERRFCIHKDVLCAHSNFFRNAVSKGFQEEKEQLVRLPETDPALFCTYAQWAYSTQVIPLSPEDLEKDEKGCWTRSAYIELYILADYLEDIQLCNTVLTLLIQSFIFNNTGPSAKMITRVWESTRVTSKLRKLLLDWFTMRAISEWLGTHRDSLPRDFYVDLAMELMKIKPAENVSKELARANKCKYHEHGDHAPPCT